MVERARYAIKDVIKDIEECFTNGFEGVCVFLEENMKIFIGEMCAPHQVMMAQILAAKPAMDFIKAVYEEMEMPELEKKEEQVEDVPMTQEMISAMTPEQRRALLRKKYDSQFAKDKAASESVRQRPLSRAYNSLNTAGTSADKTTAEEALTQTNY